jgi:periplasmic protein TonB
VKPDGGGILSLSHLLIASLLLHLAILIALSGSYRRMPADHRQSLPMSVDYLDSAAGTERSLQNPSTRIAAPKRVTPISPPVHVPKQRPVMPAGVTPSKPVGGTAPTPVPGIVPLAPVGTVSTEMAVGPVDSGTLKGRGSASDAKGGSGVGSVHHGGGPGVAQSTGASVPGQARVAGPGDYRALLKRLVEAHKEYPLAARRSRQEGSCQRRFVLNRSGTLTKVEALSSCGHAFLDDAATRAIRAVGAYPPLPDEIAGNEASFTVSITFTLSR